MITATRQTLLVMTFCALGSWNATSAQDAPATILQIELDNVVSYVYDTSDLTAYATVPTAITLTPPTFAPWVSLGDIVAVNGKPVKGTFLERTVILNLTPAPSPGQGVADIVRGNFVYRMVEIQQTDGTPIGSFILTGVNGGSAPPGAPALFTSSNLAITGGTGAFLGARGQEGNGPPIPGATLTTPRRASVRENPANRRMNGGARLSIILHVIPLSRPEIAAIPTGPAVFHADFSPVTTAKPAKAGEVLIVKATGLGPTAPGVDPGQPFPSDAIQQVNSPLNASVNGKPAEMINQIGWPGLVDTYRVDFRVPDGTASGIVGIQLTAAWVAGTSVNIPVQ